MTIDTPLRAEHERAGASLAEWFGCLLPDRYTDPTAEYSLARNSVALVDKSYRMLLEFTGADRVRYLNAVLTNNVRDLAPGQGTVSLLLNPQGHILAELEAYALPERMLVASYAMIRQRLVETIDKYIIMDDVTLTDQTDRCTVVALEGPATPEIVRELCGLELPSLPELGHAEAAVQGIACRVIRRDPGGVPSAEFIVPREDVAAIWKHLTAAASARGGGPIGYRALSMLRLEAGVPWFGYDFDDTVIPHEAGLEHSHISYTKGCYTGQEIVERVRSRGRVNRQRVGLAFSGGEPQPKEQLLAAGQEAGFVTRAAFSPALGRPIGMGYAHREFTAVGSQLEWSGGTAEVIELPVKTKSDSSLRSE